MPVLNDVHSQLNETEIALVVAPATAEEVGAAIAEASAAGLAVCPAGALHSMGGQQFASGGVSISTLRLKGIGPLDADSRTAWAQAGVTWTELVGWLRAEQDGRANELTIIQKQTGADEMTLGGALSSNIHGRVLGRKPIVDDIEAFYMTGASRRQGALQPNREHRAFQRRSRRVRPLRSCRCHTAKAGAETSGESARQGAAHLRGYTRAGGPDASGSHLRRFPVHDGRDIG